MLRIFTALRFSKWAIEFMMVPPICFLLLLAAASFLWAAYNQRPFAKGLWMPKHWFVLTQCFFFVLAIAVGVIWQNPNTNPNTVHAASRTANVLLDFVFFGSLLGALIWAWSMRRFAWYAISLLTLIELPILGALFVAGMSISGDWL